MRFGSVLDNLKPRSPVIPAVRRRGVARRQPACRLQVCQAIRHAHQKCIIHRDIKPSNVMIALSDGKPIPKVIDFGVANAIERRLTERATPKFWDFRRRTFTTRS